MEIAKESQLLSDFIGTTKTNWKQKIMEQESDMKQ